jgi:hypothetical protein
VQVERLFGIQVDVLQALHQTFHKGLTYLRPSFDGDPLAGQYDTEHFHTVVVVKHGVDVDFICPKGRGNAAEEITDDLDLLAGGGSHQGCRIHVDDIDLSGVDARRLRERGPKLKLGAAWLESDRLALQILWLDDVELLQRENADWRSRPHPCDRRKVQASAGTDHHCGQIEQAEIVLPLIHRHADFG